jgi:hypothetical protein
MYTIEILKSIAVKESEMLEINWDTIESQPGAKELLVKSHNDAVARIQELEPVYTEMRSRDIRVKDECWINEELNVCIHDIEDKLVDSYCMVNVWERYNLINNITALIN